MANDRDDEGVVPEGTPDEGATPGEGTDATADAAASDATGSESTPESADDAPRSRRRRGRAKEADDTAALVPTGKATRGSTGVRRTDADDAEDTRTKRANPVQYLRQVGEELSKVIWPIRQQMVTYTIVVFIFLVFMTALVTGVDYGSGKLVELVFKS